MAKKPGPKSDADKVNVYARVSATAWQAVHKLTSDPADPVHYGRSASQVMDMALREYVQKRAKKS